MNDLVETQILSMNLHLIKMAKYRSHESRAQRISDGRIQLDKNYENNLHEFTLNDKIIGKNEVMITGRKQKISESASADWLFSMMFYMTNQKSPVIEKP